MLIKKFRLWPDIIKRIFENQKLKNSLFSLKLDHIIILIILYIIKADLFLLYDGCEIINKNLLVYDKIKTY